MRMNRCILCGKSAGFGMVCSECKEAFLVYKEGYMTKKKLHETTELDYKVFEEVYKNLDFRTLVEDDVESLFPSPIDDLFEEAREYLEPKLNTVWLKEKEGRYENFWNYVRNRMKQDYEEIKKEQ